MPQAAEPTRENLLRFLDERLFDPVLQAKPEDYPEFKKLWLDEIQRKMRADRERMRAAASAPEVATRFREELASGRGIDLHDKLRELGLPSFADVRPGFDAIAEGRPAG